MFSVTVPFPRPLPKDVEAVFEGARIRWVAVPAGSPVVGETIRKRDIWTKSGASIIAVQRDEKTISYPSLDTKFRADGVLVVTGSADALERLLEGDRYNRIRVTRGIPR